MYKDFFSEVYLINLNSRVDRLLEAAEQMEKFDIPYKRVSAIKRDNGAEGLRDTMVMIFTEAIEQGHDNVLVFEDDVEFLNEDVNDILDKVIQQVPDSYRMVMLGGQFTRGFTNFYSPNLLPILGGFATHAVIYSKLCMEEVLALGMKYPIDNWLVTDIQTRGGCYATYPMLASQKPGISDIGGTYIDWRPFMDMRYTQKIHELKSRM